MTCLFLYQGPAPPLPIKKIFTSIPFWAIFICHFLQNFGWYMLLVEIPTFLNVGLGYDIESVYHCIVLSTQLLPNMLQQLYHFFLFQQNALLSSLPFLCNWIFSILYSSSLDFARSRGWINTTWARKLSTAIGG